MFSLDQPTVNINPMSTLMVEIALAADDLSTTRMLTILASLRAYNFGLPEGFNPVNSLMTTANTPAVLLAYEAFFEARKSITWRYIEQPRITGLAVDAPCNSC